MVLNLIRFKFLGAHRTCDAKTFILCLLSLFFASSAFSSDRPEKPNVVLMLVDDLGWQDVKCYDIDEPSPSETPNMDALAKNGVMFWQAYSPAPTCAPSRCAIMSGKHPAKAQKTHVVGGGPPTPYNVAKHILMDPWYSGRMKMSEVTIAEALKTNGYATGHVGKWHMAVGHNAFPQPKDQGFDYSKHDLGESRKMTPHRLTGFATDKANDRFQLDSEGFPKDQVTVDAIDFMKDNKDDPFFLYYAAWLVHTPIHSRSKALLEKYCKKIGVDFPTDPKGWPLKGQNNPYYSAMIEMLDHYIGMLVEYLENTDDPRWPGHKLIENTYIIFTSDNGGMEAHPGEVITDNYPLDKGKINAKEGGTRVPFIIRGPSVPKGKQSEVMVNGLDFYPTIMSWTGTEKPKEQAIDGCDISSLLKTDSSDPTLVKDAKGKVRNSMMWHFPHGVAQQSTLRVGGYKLIYNYLHHGASAKPELELYELYQNYPQGSKRGDIEEANNLAQSMPEKAEEFKQQLFKELNMMKASFPYKNPRYEGTLAGKGNVCKVIDQGRDGDDVWASYKENGAKVVKGQIVYTDNGGDNYEEWYLAPANISEGMIRGTLPEGTTHYVFNLIDENHFLVSYPDMLDSRLSGNTRGKKKYSVNAIANK